MMDDFRAQVGRVILMGAVAYCFMLTVALAFSAIFKCELSQPVRDLLIVILTWLTTKAGTVIDHQYGGSHGSDAKTDAMLHPKKEEPPCEPEPPKP